MNAISHRQCKDLGCGEQYLRVAGDEWQGSLPAFLRLTTGVEKWPYWDTVGMSAVLPSLEFGSRNSSYALAKAIVVQRVLEFPDQWLKDFRATIVTTGASYYVEDTKKAYAAVKALAQTLDPTFEVPRTPHSCDEACSKHHNSNCGRLWL